MKIKSRSQYSVLNMFTGIGGQIITMILGFVTRTVFIYTLGKSYLGISGLFSNILQVLSVTELGLESAIVFSLYKPIAQNDEEKILAIMTLYKKAYRVIGAIITVVGLCLIPLLPYLTKGKEEIINVTVVYLLYLSQTICSYLFFAYRRTIFTASQRNYIPSLISTAVKILSSVLEIVFLAVFGNFYLYVLVSVVSTIVTNLLVFFCSKKQYPYLDRKATVKLTKDEVGVIKKNVFGSAIYKVCGVVTNSMSNILISAIINIDTVGIYSNYVLFTNYIQTFLGLAFNSITASLGNLYATEGKEHNEFIFKCVNFLNFWLFGFCAVAFFVLVNPFILLWLGDSSYHLGFSTVFLMFVNLTLVGLQYSVKNYRTAYGLMARGKYRPIFTIIVNLVTSIVLGHYIGLNGIILGSIIAHITTLFWYDPYLIYKVIFEKSPKGYFIKYICNFLVITVLALSLYKLFTFFGNSLLFFILEVLITVVAVNLVFFLIYFRTKEFNYVKNAVLNMVKSKLKRK